MLVRSSNVRSRSILPTSLRSVVCASCVDGEDVVGDAVRGALRVQHLEIQHAVHLHLHVVARDADLRRDIERHFLQRVLVADRRRRTAPGCGSPRRACPQSGPAVRRRTRFAAARRSPSSTTMINTTNASRLRKSDPPSIEALLIRPTGSARANRRTERSLFGNDRQRQSVHRGDARALARIERDVAGVARAPHRAAHFDAADHARRQPLLHDRQHADQ